MAALIISPHQPWLRYLQPDLHLDATSEAVTSAHSANIGEDIGARPGPADNAVTRINPRTLEPGDDFHDFF
jgi:hypothetical protein